MGGRVGVWEGGGGVIKLGVWCICIWVDGVRLFLRTVLLPWAAGARGIEGDRCTASMRTYVPGQRQSDRHGPGHRRRRRCRQGRRHRQAGALACIPAQRAHLKRAKRLRLSPAESLWRRHLYVRTCASACEGVCAMPCRAVPCRAVPCRAGPCRAVPCRAVPCSRGLSRDMHTPTACQHTFSDKCLRTHEDSVTASAKRACFFPTWNLPFIHSYN